MPQMLRIVESFFYWSINQILSFNCSIKRFEAFVRIKWTAFFKNLRKSSRNKYTFNNKTIEDSFVILKRSGEGKGRELPNANGSAQRLSRAKF